MDFVEDTSGICEPKTRFSARVSILSFGGVDVPCALT